MSTITTIQSTDAISASRSTINTNFSNLNTDKAETSALTAGLATKQDTLVSGTNIKTVNGNSLLGSGDIVVSGGSGTLAGLTDVDIVTPANGEIISYNSSSSKWENVPLSGGGDMLSATYDPAGGARQVSFACTTQTAITDYTFTGSEARDSGYLVTTASNRTVNIDADLFSTGYEVSICKGTNNANTVTIDAQAGNNINGSQTFVLTQYNEVVTLLKDGADTWKIKSHYYPISGVNTGNETTSTIGTLINGSTEQVTPADTDRFALSISSVLRYTTWANIKAGIKTYYDSVTATLTNKTISGASNTLTVDGTNEVGYKIIPQNSQSTAYTLVLGDSGKHIYHPSADTTARTWTIPANSSVAFPIGAAITFINDTSAGAITIAITTDTLVLAGAGTTGSRTLANNGIATATKVTSTRWIISGVNLS